MKEVQARSARRSTVARGDSETATGDSVSSSAHRRLARRASASAPGSGRNSSAAGRWIRRIRSRRCRASGSQPGTFTRVRSVIAAQRPHAAAVAGIAPTRRLTRGRPEARSLWWASRTTEVETSSLGSNTRPQHHRGRSRPQVGREGPLSGMSTRATQASNRMRSRGEPSCFRVTCINRGPRPPELKRGLAERVDWRRRACGCGRWPRGFVASGSGRTRSRRTSAGSTALEGPTCCGGTVRQLRRGLERSGPACSTSPPP